MSIPNLIKSILSIHDLQAQVNDLQLMVKSLREEQDAMNVAFAKAGDHIKELEDKQDEMERECITSDDCEDLIRKEIEALDLSEEVSNAIENLNISIKVN